MRQCHSGDSGSCMKCQRETLQQTEGPMNKTPGAVLCVWDWSEVAAIITAVTSLRALLLP